jgi:hypothetical protein
MLQGHGPSPLALQRWNLPEFRLCKRRYRHWALRRQFVAMPFDAVNFV